MIKSMTAFSKAEKIEEKLSIYVEIRSYNNRYLDITLRSPAGYISFEERIKSLISEKVSRGRIEIKLQIKDEAEEACVFEINELKAAAYYAALGQLKSRFNLCGDIGIDLMANVGGIIKPAEIDNNTEARWPIVKACIEEAADGLNAMRKTEGDFIAGDFIKRLDYIEKAMAEIEEKSGSLLPYYQERLKERISALTRGIVDIDPGRISQEAAMLADRSDISEEIVRAKSHIGQFRAITDAEEPSGRKLNFLLQEFNREFNTMGSKTGNADVSHIIVNVKSELEKIREQVQNVE
ncbi:MAG: YicC family protein [Desulfobacteraceae bacterium IS3]|nr:MAG: YicC family protein [Desulfobacteraceae bacterium IS3]